MPDKYKKKEKLTADIALTNELQGSIPHANIDGVSEANEPMKIVTKDNKKKK